MRILFITENYFPYVSGVPVVVKYLAEGLRQRQHDVAIVTQKHHSLPCRECIDGVNVFRFDVWKNSLHCYVGERKEYIDFVKNYGADVNVIECTECVTTDLLLNHLKDLPGKVIFHSHGMSGFDTKLFEKKNNLKHTLGTTYNWILSHVYFKWIFQRAFKNIDAFICLSEVDSGIDYVRRNVKKYNVLDNAADDVFFDDAQCDKETLSKYVSLRHESYFVSCANYTVVKNQEALIRQYYLSESGKTNSLVCIGSTASPYYQKCKVLIKCLEERYGPRDIHLLCGVDRRDIPSIINHSSLYLVSSSWEQYSISIIEAMSRGVPFVSTDVGNARLLPGGVTIHDIRDMHVAIDTLVSNKELHSRYSEAGKTFAFQNNRIGIAVDRFENIIKETIREV